MKLLVSFLCFLGVFFTSLLCYFPIYLARGDSLFSIWMLVSLVLAFVISSGVFSLIDFKDKK